MGEADFDPFAARASAGACAENPGDDKKEKKEKKDPKPKKVGYP